MKHTVNMLRIILRSKAFAKFYAEMSSLPEDAIESQFMHWSKQLAACFLKDIQAKMLDFYRP